MAAKHSVRQSQLLTTYGPGALLDLPEKAVIVGGLDHWNYGQKAPEAVDEARLVAKLQSVLQRQNLQLRLPPEIQEGYGSAQKVTAFEFPNWFVSQKIEFSNGVRRRRLLHSGSLEKGKYQDDQRQKHQVVPIRFVRACPAGHIGDIDWKAFAHGTQGANCMRNLWIEEHGTTGDLSQTLVKCDCGASQNIGAAYRTEQAMLGFCDGARPWLGSFSREDCRERNRLLLRSASNAYFSQTLSVISIPDTAESLNTLVAALWTQGLQLVPESMPLSLARQIPSIGNQIEAYGDVELLAAIARYRSGASPQRGIKEAEFDALCSATADTQTEVPDGNFFARQLATTGSVRRIGVEKIVLVHRLREVMAQVGFTRFQPVSTDIHGELEMDVTTAKLATDANWLPAVVNRGEGVFVQLDATAINAWERRPAVIERGEQLRAAFARWKALHPSSPRAFPGLPYFLLHTLAHMLMQTIALDCGYPATSLRERIYADEGKYGLLILTAAADAQGSLGGLVQTARAIDQHLVRALSLAELCSNDPVCSQHDPIASDHLVGAACHGCLLAPETSCEQRNDFLDRALVVSTIDALGAEFFPRV